MQKHGETSATVAYTGSVVAKIERVRARLRERLEQDCPELRLTEEAVNSMEGAMWKARNAGCRE
jgi:hypothetical protein